jgi:hypothetical protein
VAGPGVLRRALRPRQRLRRPGVDRLRLSVLAGLRPARRPDLRRGPPAWRDLASSPICSLRVLQKGKHCSPVAMRGGMTRCSTYYSCITSNSQG